MYDIGYTTGVFDLFHAGHVAFLKQAKQYCNYLIVGVCSDNLTNNLKNKTPVFSEKERLEIVSSIKFVDYSYIKHSTDKVSTWEKYHFNVVFHGEQEARNRKHEIINRNKLAPLGVDFIYFDRDYRLSTSMYLKKIKEEGIGKCF